MKCTILSISCSLALFAITSACGDPEKPEPPQKNTTTSNDPQPSSLADRPLKLFSEQHAARWRTAEAIESADKRQEGYRQEYTFMVQPDRPDPQEGRIPPLHEALDGIAGAGPLKVILATTAGPIECTLFEKQAEPGVRHFVALARGKKTWWNPSSGQWSSQPFYEGTPIYRIIKNRVFYGGGPSGTGLTQLGYAAGLLPPGGKPQMNDVKYPLSFVLGEKRIAAGPQFTISAELPPFDEIPLYPIGTCAEGYATIQKILAKPAKDDGFPLEEIKITGVTFSR